MKPVKIAQVGLGYIAQAEWLPFVSRLPEIELVADFIAEVLDAEGAPAALERVRPQVIELCRRFPVYGP